MKNIILILLLGVNSTNLYGDNIENVVSNILRLQSGDFEVTTNDGKILIKNYGIMTYDNVLTNEYLIEFKYNTVYTKNKYDSLSSSTKSVSYSYENIEPLIQFLTESKNYIGTEGEFHKEFNLDDEYDDCNPSHDMTIEIHKNIIVLIWHHGNENHIMNLTEANASEFIQYLQETLRINRFLEPKINAFNSVLPNKSLKHQSLRSLDSF